MIQSIKYYCDLKQIKPTIACKESGAGKDLINQIESKGSIPSVAKVQLLAQYLGVTTSELLGETPPGGVPLVPESDTLSEEDAQLLRQIHALSPAARGKLLGYLDALSE